MKDQTIKRVSVLAPEGLKEDHMTMLVNVAVIIGLSDVPVGTTEKEIIQQVQDNIGVLSRDAMYVVQTYFPQGEEEPDVQTTEENIEKSVPDPLAVKGDPVTFLG